MDTESYSLSTLKGVINMSITINDLTTLYPEELLLNFTQKERELAWLQIQSRNYINIAARWHTYLNHLCLYTLLNYLTQEQDFDFTTKVWLKDDLPNFWQILNGSALELNHKKLIVIPHEEKNYAELRVPREWVDIPGWSGDYYLGVEINLEQCWLRIWGYATSEQLRQQGRYNLVDETYSLPAIVRNECSPFFKRKIKSEPTSISFS